MLEPKGTYISDKYTYEDYLELNFKVDSPKNIWKKAIDIFVDRIVTRYFLAIDKLMERNDRYAMRKYGFAIVTLQCSLMLNLGMVQINKKMRKDLKIF